MKRLLGLLLVMGMVGCGGGDGAPPAGDGALPATPNKSQTKVVEPSVQAVDASKLVKRSGLIYERDSETPFTGVMVKNHENRQKEKEATYKDGKREGQLTGWYENGQKWQVATFKDGKLVSETKWDEEGNEIKK